MPLYVDQAPSKKWKAMSRGSLPGEPEQAMPAEPEPALPADPEPHTCLWLARTNRQARCHGCKRMVEKYSVRLLYNPIPYRVGRGDRLVGAAWKYHHTRKDCLAYLLPILELDYAGRAGSAASIASCFDALGRSLIHAKESSEERALSTAQAVLD